MSIITVAIIIQQLTEQVFIKISFSILIDRNEELLNKTNTVLISKPGNVMYFSQPAIDTGRIFTSQEKGILNDLMKRAGIKLIEKTEAGIFYITHGFLDTHGGVLYFNSEIKPPDNVTRIKGNWYF